MNLTVSRLALQALVGQRRGLVLVALPVLLVLLATLVRMLTQEPISARLVLVEVGLAVVVPLVSLLAANGVLGPEIDDGSVVYLLATPVRRTTMAASKWATAAGVSVVLSAGGLAGAALAGGVSNRWVLGSAVGGAVGALLYTALFTAMSAATRHGMIAGLIYALVLERALGSLLTGLRHVSVQSFTQRITEAVADIDLPVSDLGLTYALVAAVVVLVGGIGMAGWRLARFQLKGDE
ncbi:ABC transporter permease [Ornithinimicrobium humiphilum]|uniref:ABC-2 type transport system permease protein n=1 Tax=Ornithinimicrobium humiphilum TaxID=125288 RepID=A0A543KRB1_9MICO|nr:ABC transporter permease [Ornithinimicrobium humiphilum]TQM97615.1 ABC-2 type transport system permease protein [Ornithinimicrobium humiphilum]